MIILIGFFLLLGLIIGSFVNCLIWRLYKDETILGRSYCPSCHKQILWYDNIPLLSFVLLRGRCRFCRKKISWQYPVVELIFGLLFLLIFLNNGDVNLLLGRDLLIMTVFGAIFIYDLKYYLVSSSLIWPSAIALIVINLFLGVSWLNLFLAILLGGGFFAIQYFITRGRGIGDGDIWIGLLMGSALGRWADLLVAIFVSYLIGFVVSIFLLLTRKKGLQSKLPLGVFLALGILIAILWGEKIVGFYHSFLI